MIIYRIIGLDVDKNECFLTGEIYSFTDAMIKKLLCDKNYPGFTNIKIKRMDE